MISGDGELLPDGRNLFEAIEDLWDEGYDTAAIAKRLMVPESVVMNHVARLTGETTAAPKPRRLDGDVIKLAWQGFTRREIAERTGRTAPAIAMILHRARRSGVPVPMISKHTVPLLETEWDALRAASSRFSTNPQRLAHQIIAIVLRDQLLDSLIDGEQLDVIGATAGTS